MNTAALVVAWWFLARPVNEMHYINRADQPPVPIAAAYGPYPTEQACIIVVHAAAPSDRRFWDAKELAKWGPFDKYEAQMDAYNTLMDKLAKDESREGTFKLPDGTIFKVTSSGLSFPHPPFFADSEQLENRMVPGTPPAAPEELANDDYTILQPCEPVKGWYAR